MSRFVVTRRALRDIVEIVEHIAECSPEAAERVEAELYEAMNQLAELPGMGHVREDLTTQSVRFWRVHSYLILYKPDTMPVQIARVLSGSRNIGKIVG